MKAKLFKYTGIILLLVSATSFAQLSQAGGYIGKLGMNDIMVAVGKQDAVNIFVFDYSSRALDVVLTGLNEANTTTGFSTRGKAYNIQVRDGVARGTFGGVSFSAQKESLYGQYYKNAGGYNGVIQDERLNTSILVVNFSATGKVVLINSSSLGDVGGIGQVSSAGQVTVPMTDGSVYSFVFRPDPLLLVAARGAISVNGRNSLSYLLFSNSTTKLANISTRGNATPTAPLTAGFVITEGAKTVLIRGIGPALAQFGVPNACPDTQLTLFSGQRVIATNSDWGLNSNVQEFPTASAQVGAFALPTGSRDAVLLVTLEPGAYTVELGVQGVVSGEVLVEVYQVN